MQIVDRRRMLREMGANGKLILTVYIQGVGLLQLSYGMQLSILYYHF